MKVYVINLKTSIKRKHYMEDILFPYRDFLEVDFIEAVDGRNLSEKQLMQIWNQVETYRNYGRYMRGGEVGCALSHRKCCEEMLKNNEKIALIVEDDLVLQNAKVKEVILSAKGILETEQPTIVLLSGDYWYTRKKQIIKGSNLWFAKVREAICTQAYLINQSAAKIVASTVREYLADDWYNWKRQGIALYAAYPHIADQNRRDFNTEVSTAYEGTIRKNLSFTRRLHSYYRAVVKRILASIGYIERKSFMD